MKRRRVLLCAPLAVLAALVLAAVADRLLPPPETAITRENAARITPGMTLTEVEALLGGSAGDEAGAWIGTKHIRGMTTPVARDDEMRTWRGPQYVITVAFDSGGYVIDYALGERCDSERSLWTYFRGWLGV